MSKSNNKSNGKSKDRFNKGRDYKKGNSKDIRYKQEGVNTDSRSKRYWEKADPDNDAAWYAANPQLLTDVASLPFGVPLGNRLNLGTYGADINGESVPGVAAIEIALTYGNTNSNTSALNVASRNQYSWVRHANSGHANYDDPDLMLYYAAMDNIYAFIEWCKRLYGVAMTYSQTNRYYPLAVVQACGVDFNNLQQHLADFRAYINNLVVRAGSLCVPATMSAFIRHSWLFRNLYLDSQAIKSQTYLYNPFGFHRFDLDEEGKGCLKFHGRIIPGNEELRSIPWIMQYGEKLLAPILASEDIGVMSGDTLKAFGEASLVKLTPIAEDYSVLPVYSVEVLNQIHNTVLCGTPHWINDPDVLWQVQETELSGFVLRSHFTTNYDMGLYGDENNKVLGLNPYLMDKVLDLAGIDHSPASVMVSTRLTNIARDTTEGDTTYLEWPTVASEAATCMRIYRYADDGYGTWKLYSSGPLFSAMPIIINNDPDEIVPSIRQFAKMIQLVSQFEMHPLMYLIGAVRVPGESYYKPITVNQIFGDISDYTVVDEYELENLAHTALLSEYNVMQYGKVQG